MSEGIFRWRMPASKAFSHDCRISIQHVLIAFSKTGRSTALSSCCSPVQQYRPHPDAGTNEVLQITHLYTLSLFSKAQNMTWGRDHLFSPTIGVCGNQLHTSASIFHCGLFRMLFAHRHTHTHTHTKIRVWFRPRWWHTRDKNGQRGVV